MNEAQDYILNIKNEQLKSNKDILDSLAGAIDRLQKAFPRYGSFLMEFVQNADDAKSKSLKIEILTDSVKIHNDGEIFSGDDVKSICKVGRSSKNPEDYIGYLGVGFKSVFLISERPEIYSGDFRFKFSKNNWEDSVHIPWQVIPIWIDDPQTEISNKYRTTFILPLKETKMMDLLREEIKSAHLNSRILLFLRNIKEIEIVDLCKEFERKIVKTELSIDSDYEIYQVEEYENSNLVSQDRWLIFRSSCIVPKEVKNDYVTKDWERDGVNIREVVVAFKLDIENCLEIERGGTAHIGVFSFLPLKEIPSGLKFLIQADFLTSPGRGELSRECLWNNWLAEEISKLIIKKCIPIFLKDGKWKMNFTDILYSSKGGHELFEEHIKKPLRNILEDTPVLIAEDESIAKPSELVEIGEKVRKILNKDDLRFLFPGKKVMHSNCKPSPELKIEKVWGDIYNFICNQEKGEQLVKRKAQLKDIAWFKKIFSYFVNEYTIENFRWRYSQYNRYHDDFWNRMHNFHRPLIPTENFKLSKINNCYTNPKKIKIPWSIRKKINIVHIELSKDEKFREFIKKLNEERYLYPPPSSKVIRELTEDDIRNVLKEKEAIELTPEKWRKLPDSERIKKIKYLKDLWNANYISIENYSFLTLLDKKWEWVKPEDLIFSKEFKPGHSIEILVEKELLDKPLRFINPVFIEGEDEEDEIRKWRKFFEKMGVDTILEENKTKNPIIERIAILTANEYEKKMNRNPKELGESQKLGYDIESKSESELRFIEVKGTLAELSTDIFLTPNEFNTLRNYPGKYFIYLVLNTFKAPTLYILGEEILNKKIDKNVKIIIQFDSRKDTDTEVFQP
jgi:hypothetical protein